MELALRIAIDAALPRDEAVQAVADAGYHAVLLDFTGPGGAAALEQVTGAVAAKTADVFDQAGVEIAGLAVAVDLAGGGDQAAVLVSTAIRLAHHFGTDRVVCGVGPAADWTAVLEPLQELLDEAEEESVDLALWIAPEQAIGDVDTAELLLDALDADFVPLAIDPLALAASGGLDPADVLARVGDAVSVVSFGGAAGGERGSTGAQVDLAALCELIAQEAPDAVVVVEITTPAATCNLLARLL